MLFISGNGEAGQKCVASVPVKMQTKLPRSMAAVGSMAPSCCTPCTLRVKSVCDSAEARDTCSFLNKSCIGATSDSCENSLQDRHSIANTRVLRCHMRWRGESDQLASPRVRCHRLWRGRIFHQTSLRAAQPNMEANKALRALTTVSRDVSTIPPASEALAKHNPQSTVFGRCWMKGDIISVGTHLERYISSI